MFQICCKDMPEGFDPSNKNQFNKARIHRFMGHEDLSVRSRTNKKKKSIFERMHKIMKKTRLPLHRNRLHLQRKHHRDLGHANQRYLSCWDIQVIKVGFRGKVPICKSGFLVLF